MRPTLTLIALVTAAPLSAQVYEDIGALDVRIAAATGAATGQPGGAAALVDPRLKLARCPSPVSVEPAYQGAFTLRCAALGWRIRVPAVGEARPIAAAIAVKRGDVVDLTVAGGGFEVSTTAVADADAATGATVRVKILTSGALVSAVVTGAGHVRVTP